MLLLKFDIEFKMISIILLFLQSLIIMCVCLNVLKIIFYYFKF